MEKQAVTRFFSQVHYEIRLRAARSEPRGMKLSKDGIESDVTFVNGGREILERRNHRKGVP